MTTARRTAEPNATDPATSSLVADAFADVLRGWLTPTQLRQVRRMNRDAGPDSGCCASHDFCDADMAMLTAYCLVTGVAEDDADLDALAAEGGLFDAAWATAKLRHLTG